MINILVANLYGQGNDNPVVTARWINKISPSVGILSEFDNPPHQQIERALRNLGWFVYNGHQDHGAREVAVITKARATKHETYKVSPYVRIKVAHDRWVTRVQTGRRVVYSVHWNAAVQSGHHWKAWRVARVQRKAAKRLVSEIQRDQTDGLHVIVGGDLNWRRNPGPLVQYSPEWIFQQCGLDYVNTELIWLAWDRSAWHEKQRHVYPTTPTGSRDKHPHQALVVTLEWTESRHA